MDYSNPFVSQTFHDFDLPALCPQLQYPYSDVRQASPIYHNHSPYYSTPMPNQYLADVYQPLPLHSSNYVSNPSSTYVSNCYPPPALIQDVHPDPIHIQTVSDIPLHAPIPMVTYTPLLSRPNTMTVPPNRYPTAPTAHHQPQQPQPQSALPKLLPPPQPQPQPQPQQTLALPTPAPTDTMSQFPQHQEMLNFYAKASEHTFPTPSELLSQLTGLPQCGPTAPAHAPPEPEKRVESQRKARHRAVAQSVGFEPTDP
jgi:hypothetical protein